MAKPRRQAVKRSGSGFNLAQVSPLMLKLIMALVLALLLLVGSAGSACSTE